MSPEELPRGELIDRVAEAVSQDPHVRALLLSGSLGRGTADQYSDADFLVVMDEAASVAAFAAAWPERRQAVSEFLQDARLDFGSTVLFNHITVDWHRFDVFVVPKDGLGRPSQSTVRPVFDRGDVYGRLPPELDPLRPSPDVVQRLVPEFFRVLALVTVVLGREDHVVGASGSGLLRTMLIQAVTELTTVEDRGGALHLKALLSPEHYDLVAKIPAIEATADSVAAVHLYCARAFVPVAQELCAATGMPWPDEWVSAVAARTSSVLGSWL